MVKRGLRDSELGSIQAEPDCPCLSLVLIVSKKKNLFGRNIISFCALREEFNLSTTWIGCSSWPGYLFFMGGDPFHVNNLLGSFS